jgi:hypothetical protein
VFVPIHVCYLIKFIKRHKMQVNQGMRQKFSLTQKYRQRCFTKKKLGKNYVQLTCNQLHGQKISPKPRAQYS